MAITVEFYVAHKPIKRCEMPGVPRIGEAVIMGYGENYNCWRVLDVTWDADPPGDAHATAGVTLGRPTKCP